MAKRYLIEIALLQRVAGEVARIEKGGTSKLLRRLKRRRFFSKDQ